MLFRRCIRVAGSMSGMGGSRTAVDPPHPARWQLFGNPVPKSAKPPRHFVAANAPESCRRSERPAVDVTEQHKGSGTELVGKGPAQAVPAQFAAHRCLGNRKDASHADLELDQDVEVYDLLHVHSQNL
jgi:hypothetical protein